MALIAVPVGMQSKLYYSLDGTTFVLFGHIEDITANELTAPEIKTTKLDSVAEESQPGLPDYGTTTLKLRYAAANHTLIKGWMDTMLVIHIKAVVNDGTSTQSSDVCAAWVKSWKWADGVKVNGELLSAVTFKLTLNSTFTAGT